MPRVDGFEVLRWIRQQPGLKALRVVVLPCSEDLGDGLLRGCIEIGLSPPLSCYTLSVLCPIVTGPAFLKYTTRSSLSLTSTIVDPGSGTESLRKYDHWRSASTPVRSAIVRATLR